MSATLFDYAAGLLLVFGFALTLGAQAFDTFVNVPVFFADPPRSIADYSATPAMKRVPPYFIRAMILVIVGVLAATAALIVNRGPVALIVADGCALAYIAMIFVVFVPINRKLGFLPGGEPADPREAAALARQWRAWNAVRLLTQALGLGAAALSLASK